MPPTDGKSMLHELVELFLEEAPPRLARIGESVNDPPQLAFNAHALKSISLNLGARRLIDVCQKLETIGQTGSLDGASALVQELQTVFTQTKAQLLPLRGPSGS